MTPSLLKLIHSKLDHTDPIQVVFWGINISAFLLLFRKSNSVPTRVDGFNGKRQLKHGDCVIQSDRQWVVVGIRWAKNYQFNNELLTFPLPALLGSVLCPVTAIENIRRLIPATEQDHIFQLPGGGSFTYRRFQNQLRTLLKNANVPDYTSYSSHNYWRGGQLFLPLWGPVPPHQNFRGLAFGSVPNLHRIPHRSSDCRLPVDKNATAGAWGTAILISST